MSRLSEYAKFDHLDEDEDSVKDDEDRPPTASSIPLPPEHPGADMTMTRDTATKRWVFAYQGVKVYEWEQGLNDVNIYIFPPHAVTSAAQLVVDIAAQHVSIGLRDADRAFLDAPLFAKIDTTESTWTLEPDEHEHGRHALIVYLQKMAKGTVWSACTMGRHSMALNEAQLEEERQKMLLQRWQEENPHMDFRDATFNGTAPDPRSYMGGVKYD